MNRYLTLLFLLLPCAAFSQHLPSFEAVISLRGVGAVQLSPDGKLLAYTVQTADWSENRYDTEIWLWREGGEPFQATNNPKGNSVAPIFSTDGKWLIFLSDRGDKNQV